MGDYAILLDLERCLGCTACVVACKAGNELADGQHFIAVREEIRGSGTALEGTFLHQRCYHCADAACVAVCPTGALSKQNGLTAVNVEACSGCGYCVEACPFDIPTLVDGRVSKCSGCADLIAEGGTPYCVQTCPSKALRVGPREALVQEATARAAQLRARRPEAQVYGLDQLGGLGLLTVLPYAPESVGLQARPRPTPPTIRLWQDVVQPATAGLTGVALAVTAGAFALARRNHRRELAEAPETLATPQAAPSSTDASSASAAETPETLATPQAAASGTDASSASEPGAQRAADAPPTPTQPAAPTASEPKE